MSRSRGGTVTAILWIAIALVTWFGLYQSFTAFVTRPPETADLVRVEGRIARVDTPVPRNRNEPYSELLFEVSVARVLRVPVRHSSMTRGEIEALAGRSGEAQYAAKRPRNRWVYELVVDGRTILALANELDRDDGVRRAAMLRAIISAILAGALLVLAIGRKRSRRT